MVMRFSLRWEITRPGPALMAPWTWPAMSGNGWQTGMVKTIMPPRLPATQPGLLRVNIASCGAAPGTMKLSTCERLTETGSTQTTAGITPVFVVPANFLNSSLGFFIRFKKDFCQRITRTD